MCSSSLRGRDRPLTAAYDLAMLDLDGVVYIGAEAVPGVAEHLRSARAAGMRIAFVTNNAARTPAAVATHLGELGVEARAADVVTSAQAAARLTRELLGLGDVGDRDEADGPDDETPTRSRGVLCLGAEGLATALSEAGVPILSAEAAAADLSAVSTVVTGYGPEVLWRDIMTAAVLVRDGVPWVASNTDATIPTRLGTAPGHGALVELIERFSGVRPVVAGKPERPLLDETVERVGGTRPLMVGDRLDTDIEGGRNAGVDTLLVLTGVTGLSELAGATPARRPTYLARDLGGLTSAHTAPRLDGRTWSAGGWEAVIEGGRLLVSGAGEGDDWWRAVAAAAWAHLDVTGESADTTRVTVPACAQVPR